MCYFNNVVLNNNIINIFNHPNAYINKNLFIFNSKNKYITIEDTFTKQKKHIKKVLN